MNYCYWGLAFVKKESEFFKSSEITDKMESSLSTSILCLDRYNKERDDYCILKFLENGSMQLKVERKKEAITLKQKKKIYESKIILFIYIFSLQSQWKCQFESNFVTTDKLYISFKMMIEIKLIFKILQRFHL